MRTFRLTAAPADVDLGGTVVSTWAYGGSIPGTALRAAAGDRVAILYSNELPVASSVHWHGLAIANAMDGVPGVTTPEVGPGGTFRFDFVVPDPGTHWFHPHSGLQLDRGLYAPFIVDDPGEPGDYDHEWVVVLDDWTDGVGPSPEQVMADLRDSGSRSMMGGMMGGSADGDVAYPMFLINGRPGNDPDALTARPGQRVRLRLINAAADTIFTVALAGHDLTVTHSDGFPVELASTGALRIGMGPSLAFNSLPFGEWRRRGSGQRYRSPCSSRKAERRFPSSSSAGASFRITAPALRRRSARPRKALGTEPPSVDLVATEATGGFRPAFLARSCSLRIVSAPTCSGSAGRPNQMRSLSRSTVFGTTATTMPEG